MENEILNETSVYETFTKYLNSKKTLYNAYLSLALDNSDEEKYYQMFGSIFKEAFDINNYVSKETFVQKLKLFLISNIGDDVKQSLFDLLCLELIIQRKDWLRQIEKADEAEIKFESELLETISIDGLLLIQQLNQYQQNANKGKMLFWHITYDLTRMESDVLTLFDIIPKDVKYNQKKFQRFFPKQLNEQTQKTSKDLQDKPKTDKLKAPLIAMFCWLVNEIGIDKKEDNESAEKYCKRICKKFNFDYVVRVRINFQPNNDKKHRKEFAEKILPKLEAKTKKTIEDYLDSKNPPKQKLYA